MTWNALAHQGTLGIQRLHAPLLLLIPLIGVKIAIDLYAHLKEHRTPSDLAGLAS